MSSFQRASTEVEWNKQTTLRDSRLSLRSLASHTALEL